MAVRDQFADLFTTRPVRLEVAALVDLGKHRVTASVDPRKSEKKTALAPAGMTFGSLARQHGWGSLKGKFVLTSGLGEMGGAQPLAVLVEGQFPDTWAGREVPAWPAAPGEEADPLAAGAAHADREGRGVGGPCRLWSV